MAHNRLTAVLSHVHSASNGASSIIQQNSDDIVITAAVRTPLCKAGTGAFKDTELDGLIFKILEQLRLKSKISPDLVEDVCLGNVRNVTAPYYVRAASLAAGFPNTCSASSVNRFCASGLAAINEIASEIRTGMIEIGIAVGAEFLTDGNVRFERPFVDDVMSNSEDARDCLIPMAHTSEIVAREFNITRQQQDEYATESCRRAELAQKSGWFDDEIVPISTKKDGKDVTVTRDDIRWGTTFEKINTLPPSFPEYGDTTNAGNASKLMDGAAAVLLMKRSKAIELKQSILGKYVGATLAGLPPRIMGIGPALAIPKLLAKYNLSQEDIDVVEINEAFASMAVYCRDKLNLDWNKMNPRGGAIALGHPFGCTGVRQVVTGLSECRRQKKRLLITSMCMGTGMGMAGLFVNEQV